MRGTATQLYQPNGLRRGRFYRKSVSVLAKESSLLALTCHEEFREDDTDVLDKLYRKTFVYSMLLRDYVQCKWNGTVSDI